MKTKFFLIAIIFSTYSNVIYGQIKFGERALGAIGKGLKSLTFSDADAANLSLQAVTKMDAEAKIAAANDAYSARLNRVFRKHAAEGGLKLNYKVYLDKNVNAFATADGSVRVFAGLMDIMDDNELLAVIGHEIGHVANKDSRDAMRAAYRKAALVDAAASQSDKVAAVTDGQLGQIANAMVDSKHSRTQEAEADTFSYDFMKRNQYDVNAVESAFNILSKMAGGAEAGFLEKMMSTHPDPSDIAAIAKQRSEADGLYKPYTRIVRTTAPPAQKRQTKKK
jgi:putative metalloprotease